MAPLCECVEGRAGPSQARLGTPAPSSLTDGMPALFYGHGGGKVARQRYRH